MTVYAIIFYLLALLILGSTAVAITRRNLVHVVIYLIFSFFGSAMLFYLLGAPYLAILEVIIYAGAIMVLFLFIVIMMKLKKAEKKLFPLQQLLPALEARMIELDRDLQQSAALPAWGDAGVCVYCEFSGLCRRDMWFRGDNGNGR